VTTRYTKTIVCLANSRKPPSGRCIAGREVTQTGFGNWIRAHLREKLRVKVEIQKISTNNRARARLEDVLFPIRALWFLLNRLKKLILSFCQACGPGLAPQMLCAPGAFCTAFALCAGCVLHHWGQ
jgi:hypothetical protein